MSQVIVLDSIKESISLKEKFLRYGWYTDQILDTFNDIYTAVTNGKKIMICGNGGSAADAQHIAAEFIVRYKKSSNRPPLPCIALTTDSSIITAGGNDLGFEEIFSQQVMALGNPGDVLIGISTSGNSENVLKAVYAANERGINTIGLLGDKGGSLQGICNKSIVVPSNVTARIQEVHIMIGHIWCEIMETKF
jgi:D-sedoheptulose 7-phosphate isomerase